MLKHDAGFGKTLYTEQALIEATVAGKRSILCRKFIEDCTDSAKRINKDYGMDIAIAIDSENVAKNKHLAILVGNLGNIQKPEKHMRNVLRKYMSFF